MKHYSAGFLPGFIIGILCACGCAATFPYRHYAPSMDASCYDNGRLLGKLGSDGWPDLSMSECKPDPDPSPGASPGPSPIKLKCQVIFESDLTALKTDYEQCHKDLQICQQGQPPQQ